MEEPGLNAFRSIPYMGVIWVVAEAMKLGFRNGHPEWCNLGQGQPEVGEMDGAPPRPSEIKIEAGDHAYGPVGGTEELQQKQSERQVPDPHRFRLRSSWHLLAGSRWTTRRLMSALPQAGD